MKETITQRSEFECSYIMYSAQEGYQFNSHNYKIEVTVSGEPDNNGVILPFKKFKQCIDEVLPNNSFIFNSNECSDSPSVQIADILKCNDVSASPIGYPFSICAENLVQYFAMRIQSLLDHRLEVTEVKLRETNNSYVSWKSN